MREQIENVIEYIKTLEVNGCITGSCLLDYFDNQDVDIFIYDKNNYTKLLYALYYNDMFVLADNKEKWKFNQFTLIDKDKYKTPVMSIVFLYNTCVRVNIILKQNATDIFSVLSSFDMNIICKGYDIKTKQVLDLTGDSTKTKIVDWNRWNPQFYDWTAWSVRKILRQIDRCPKYHERGYNTDNMIRKYIEIMDETKNIENVFESESFSEQLKELHQQTDALKGFCKLWLDTHYMSDETKLELKQKIKSLC